MWEKNIDGIRKMISNNLYMLVCEGIALAKIDKANKTTFTDTLDVQIIKTTLLDAPKAS